MNIQRYLFAKHYVFTILRTILHTLVHKELRVFSESLYTGFSVLATKKVTLKDFPIYANGDVAFYKYPFLTTNNYQYFAQVHGQRFVTDVTVGKRAYINYTSEIITGELCRKHTDISVNEPSVIPVSLINKISDARLSNIDITTKTGKTKLYNLKCNRFHYLPIDSKTKLSVYVDGDYILGKPLAIEQSIKTNKKLVLSIFVDGLAAAILKSINLKDLMPNTHEYFKDGSLYYNGYANAAWTLPSVGSIVSGLYSINHGLYHPYDEEHVGVGYKIMSDYYQENGYLTSQICSNHRKSPAYNYSQGFDRTLYRYGMGCEEGVVKAMEQLRAFKNRSQFIWLTLFETHHFMHGIPDISNQVATELDLHNYGDCNIKSPFLSASKNRTERYILELKRVDFYLKLLFDYIGDNYNDEEVVVSLCSDHGKSFLADEPGLLAPHKVQVPMFFKSTDVKPGEYNNIVENIDFLPSLLDLSGIQYAPDVFDGQSVFSNAYDKQYAISEVLYPDDYYYVAIYSNSHKFYIKSHSVMKVIDDVDLYNCSYTLEDLHGNIIENSDTDALKSDLAREYFSYIVKRKR